MFLLLLAAFAAANWAGPKRLATIGSYMYNHVVSVYRDPSTHINHMICCNRFTFNYWHFAVLDDGTVLHSYFFDDLKRVYVATLRGNDDGKHLYMGMWSAANSTLSIAGFTESSDGGRTWANVQPLLTVEWKRKVYQDTLFIKETGRVIIFASVDDNTIRMVSRAPGSLVFSSEAIIVQNAPFNDIVCRAAYSVEGGKTVFHLFFTNFAMRLSYTRSTNNGVSWSTPREITSATAPPVAKLIHAIATQGRLYLSYTVQGAPAVLLYSLDGGKTYASPVNITDRPAMYDTPQGVAVCRGDSNVMVTMFATHDEDNGDEYPEYAFWDLKTMTRHVRKQPYNIQKIKNVGVDCEVSSGKIHVATFAMQEDHHDQQTYVYYAGESDTVSVSSDTY